MPANSSTPDPKVFGPNPFELNRLPAVVSPRLLQAIKVMNEFGYDCFPHKRLQMLTVERTITHTDQMIAEITDGAIQAELAVAIARGAALNGLMMTAKIPLAEKGTYRHVMRALLIGPDVKRQAEPPKPVSPIIKA